MAENITLARPYAQALFDTARESGALAQWSAALNGLAQVARDAGAHRYLANPGLTDAERVAFLVSVLAGAVDDGGVLASQPGQNFLRLAAENDRLDVLVEIAERFDILKAQAERTIQVSIVTATPIDAELAQRIGQSLEKRLGRGVELNLSVDPDLIGGAVIRAEDQVIDGSVRSRLQSLSQALVS
jgi:F-type H+-transporting ATPase subunit delta